MLRFITNVEDEWWQVASALLRVELDALTEEPAPYLFEAKEPIWRRWCTAMCSTNWSSWRLCGKLTVKRGWVQVEQW